MCGLLSNRDGRWRTAQCSSDLPTACRGANGEWTLAWGARGVCPKGTMFELPHHAKENWALQDALKTSGKEAAWLPLQGAHASSHSLSAFPRPFWRFFLQGYCRFPAR